MKNAYADAIIRLAQEARLLNNQPLMDGAVELETQLMTALGCATPDTLWVYLNRPHDRPRFNLLDNNMNIDDDVNVNVNENDNENLDGAGDDAGGVVPVVPVVPGGAVSGGAVSGGPVSGGPGGPGGPGAASAGSGSSDTVQMDLDDQA